MRKRHARLTRREKDIIRLGALGYCDKEIAGTLHIGSGTVRTYFTNLRLKIGSFDRQMLPGIGLLLGIVSIADITRGALRFLQQQVSDPFELVKEREFHEGSD